MACEKHKEQPVKGYNDCPGCEVEMLRNKIYELKEALVRCRHQASYSIGDRDALSRQLNFVREIVNEALNV